MMNCQETKRMIDAYRDGEVGAAQIFEIERHLQGCAACSQIDQASRALADAIALRGRRFAATPELRGQVLDALRTESRRPRVISLYPRERVVLWAIAAVALFGAFFAGTLVSQRSPVGRNALDDEIIAIHVRSMMASHLADIVSTDQHTVKPWFDGKLDFAPPVAEYGADQFLLVGGRLDYLDGRAVAALVYRHDKHIINLLVRPAPARSAGVGSENRAATVNGYHLLQWSDTGMSYAAVSDLNADDLRRFARLVGAR